MNEQDKNKPIRLFEQYVGFRLFTGTEWPITNYLEVRDGKAHVVLGLCNGVPDSGISFDSVSDAWKYLGEHTPEPLAAQGHAGAHWLAHAPDDELRYEGIAVDEGDRGWRICATCDEWFWDGNSRLINDPPRTCGLCQW